MLEVLGNQGKWSDHNKTQVSMSTQTRINLPFDLIELHSMQSNFPRKLQEKNKQQATFSMGKSKLNI